MVDFIDTFLYKLRFFIIGGLIVVSLLILPFLLSTIWTKPKAQAQEIHSSVTTSTSAADIENNPNIITSGMFKAADGIGRITNSAEQAVNNSVRSAAKTIATATAQSGKFVVDSVDTGATLVAHGVGSGVEFAAEATGSTIGLIADTPPVSVIIKPDDKTPIPVIDAHAHTHAVAATQTDMPAANALPQPHIDSEASWPMHGAITTKFGVPHRPWQPTHTGIDISSGNRSGVTIVKPFKPGRVTETTRSRVGLGNHVVVDHGGGMTSVYAHLYSFSVQVGQEVNKNTVLGYEGSTGASTGTHLHFEIVVNGQYVDPRQYVSGQP